MVSRIIETTARTTHDGMLNLSVQVDVADADVAVTVHVKTVLRSNEDVDANGWPKGFFDRIAGSMPELERAPQGNFETRQPIE